MTPWANFRVYVLIAVLLGLNGQIQMWRQQSVLAFVSLVNGILIALVAVSYAIAERNRP